ncbi:MAG: hypothetical protein KF799_09520 [Bdellovibrionales bacterium]|nr:hypothetical protein [Bdellovibrionales bacterium]
MLSLFSMKSGRNTAGGAWAQWGVVFSFRVILTASLALQSASAFGKDSCEIALSTIGSLKTRFSSVVIEQIRNHPVYELGRKYKDGEGLRFTSKFFREPYEMHLPNFEVGESIQGAMVQETLKTIFPKAEFRRLTAFDQDPGWGRRINVVITDSAEHGGLVDIHASPVMEMGIIKQANPGVPQDRDLARARLGLTSSERVVTIYASRWNFPRLPAIILALRNSPQPPNVIFVASGGSATGVDDVVKHRSYDMRGDRAYKNMRAFAIHTWPYQMHDLSRILHFNSLPRDSGLTFVMNDMVGAMPLLYAASDAAIVVGPINILEPLSQKTPVIYFADAKTIGFYSYFSTMAWVAEETGAGFPVEEAGEVPSRYNEALNVNSKILSPHLVTLSSGKTVFQTYLDHLQRYLENQDL